MVEAKKDWGLIGIFGIFEDLSRLGVGPVEIPIIGGQGVLPFGSDGDGRDDGFRSAAGNRHSFEVAVFQVINKLVVGEVAESQAGIDDDLDVPAVFGNFFDYSVHGEIGIDVIQKNVAFVGIVAGNKRVKIARLDVILKKIFGPVINEVEMAVIGRGGAGPFAAYHRRPRAVFKRKLDDAVISAAVIKLVGVRADDAEKRAASR